jgi:hypothetical protein
MADMEDGAAPRGTRDSALRPAASDLHPADPADDLSGNTPGGGTGTPPAQDAGWPTEDAADGEALGADLPDASSPDASSPDASGPDASGPDAPLPGDTVPGDGTVDPGRTASEVDALRTAEYGRESEDAAAVTSDSAPRPTETPVE